MRFTAWSQPCAGSRQAVRKLRLNLGGNDVWPGSCHLSAEVAELLGDQGMREPCIFPLFILPGFWRTSAPSPMSLQRDAGLQHLPAPAPAPAKIPDGADHTMAAGPSAGPQAQKQLDDGSRRRREGEERRQQSTSPRFNRSTSPTEACQLPGAQPRTRAGLVCWWPGAGPDEAGSACYAA